MSLYTTLAVMQLSPPVDRQAERYGCRVECEHLVLDEELLQAVTLPACNLDKSVCIFFTSVRDKKSV